MSEASGRLRFLLGSIAGAAGDGVSPSALVLQLLREQTEEQLECLLDEALAHPLLSDVAIAAKGEDLDALHIALEKERGVAFHLPVLKLNGESVKVWATDELTVRELRERLQKAIAVDLKEKGEKRRALDWRRVWNTHCLLLPSAVELATKEGEQRGKRLLDLDATLKDMSVTAGSVLVFSPYIDREKGHRRARHYRYQRPPPKTNKIQEDSERPRVSVSSRRDERSDRNDERSDRHNDEDDKAISHERMTELDITRKRKRDRDSDSDMTKRRRYSSASSSRSKDESALTQSRRRSPLSRESEHERDTNRYHKGYIGRNEDGDRNRH